MNLSLNVTVAEVMLSDHRRVQLWPMSIKSNKMFL